MDEKCQDCRFWTFIDEGHWIEVDGKFKTAGHCRRYPTRTVKSFSDWCGEWQPKKQDQGPDQ